MSRRRGGRMRRHTESNPADTATTMDHGAAPPDGSENGGLPNRLMTAFEVAEFVGCHEETVRRAYWRGLLTSQRFGVRGRRFIRAMSSTGSNVARQHACRKSQQRSTHEEGA